MKPRLVAIAIAAFVACALASVAFGHAGHMAVHKPGGFASPAMPQAATWNLTLNETGTYYFHCHPHPWMEGVIRVQNGTADSAIVHAKDYAFTPAEVLLRPGGTIEFVNDDNDTHYVVESVAPAGAETGGNATPAPAILALLAVGTAGLLRRWGKARRR